MQGKARFTHDDEGRVIEAILAVDIDAALAYKLLALAEVAVPTGEEELGELLALVEGVLVLQHIGLDQDALFAWLPVQLVLAEHHGEIVMM